MSARAVISRSPTTIAPSACPLASSTRDRKSTRLNSSHSQISYAVFCLKKKNRHYDSPQTSSIITTYLPIIIPLSLSAQHSGTSNISIPLDLLTQPPLPSTLPLTYIPHS